MFYTFLNPLNPYLSFPSFCLTENLDRNEVMLNMPRI